jgi:hypothetical protein
MLESRGFHVLITANIFETFRAQRHPVGLCQYSFFLWETSSKAPSRTYCQYSYFLHLFIYFICIYHEYTHPRYSFIPMDIPIFLLFKIPNSLFYKARFSFKILFQYNSSFHFFKVSKHPILCNSLIKHGVISNLSKSSKSQSKIFNQVLNSNNHTNLSPK